MANNIERASEICQKVDTLLSEISIEGKEYPNFAQLNIYLLKNIFYEFFFYEGFTKLVEGQFQMDYEFIIKKAGALEESSSSLVFKVIGWLELQKRSKEGLKLLNKMLQFYFDNNQKQKAFLLILFIMHYGEKNRLKEVNYEYLNQLLDELTRQMKEKESTLTQLNILTIHKYEKLLVLIETFNVESKFKQKDIKLLKMFFLQTLPVQERDKYRRISDLRFYCYIFNEEDYLKNIEIIEQKVRKVKYAPQQKRFLDRLKWLSIRIKRFVAYEGTFYVLKFNTTSKGYKFRYLKVTRNYLAIVNEKSKDRVFTDLTERGVCNLKR